MDNSLLCLDIWKNSSYTPLAKHIPQWCVLWFLLSFFKWEKMFVEMDMSKFFVEQNEFQNKDMGEKKPPPLSALV